jgi:uncharacterized protein YicC (UPF0701 family)
VEELRAMITTESGRLLKTMHQNREEMEGELAAVKAKFQDDLRATRDQLAGELEKNVSALRDSSVARESLAELFQELALKLRKHDVLEEFRNAVRTGEGA